MMSSPDQRSASDTRARAEPRPTAWRKKKTRRGYVEVGLIFAGMSALLAGIVTYTLAYL